MSPKLFRGVQLLEIIAMQPFTRVCVCVSSSRGPPTGDVPLGFPSKPPKKGTSRKDAESSWSPEEAAQHFQDAPTEVAKLAEFRKMPGAPGRAFWKWVCSFFNGPLKPTKKKRCFVGL